MKELNTQTNYLKLLENTLGEIRELQMKFPEITIYNSIIAQLEFISKILVDEYRYPSEEEADSIMIGPIAIKNFNESMPEIAKKLMNLDYYFGNFDELSEE